MAELEAGELDSGVMGDGDGGGPICPEEEAAAGGCNPETETLGAGGLNPATRPELWCSLGVGLHRLHQRWMVVVGGSEGHLQRHSPPAAQHT